MVENNANTPLNTQYFHEIISVILCFIWLPIYFRRLFVLINNKKYNQNILIQSNFIFQNPFQNTEKQIPFSEWVLSLDSSKIKSISKLSIEERSKIINKLIQYAIIEPKVPLNESCRPKLQMSLNCEDYFLSFNGEREPQVPKPKIAHLIQYGFETDVLEVLLSEIYDYVDRIFIVESEITHYQSIKKDLVWPLLSKQKRFKRYLDKIIYFNISKEMAEEYSTKILKDQYKYSIWKNELIQEHLRFKLFQDWNSKNNDFFKGDDIIGFGDTDEIPSFHNLILLKKCKMRGTTDIGIWFTFNQVRKYFNSHHPVLNHKDTLGDPTYWYLKDAIKKGNPSRNRGKSPFFVLGGIHLTRYGYLPNLLLKDLSQTENDNGGVLLAAVQRQLKRRLSVDEVSRQIFSNIDFDENYLDLPSQKLNTPPFMIPWIMQCNPKRYPSFFELNIPDTRID